jgi:hypothetical protein
MSRDGFGGISRTDFPSWPAPTERMCSGVDIRLLAHLAVLGRRERTLMLG